jgi:hypothetical protein
MPNTPKKQRRKATTEIGRSIMQRERQRLAREQANLGESLVREAERRHSMETMVADPEHNAISRGIVRRIAAVLASEDVNVPLYVTKGEKDRSVVAWTDFNRISVTYRPLDDKRVLAAALRGGIYHEAGHCRFTPPPATMFKAVEQAFGPDDMPYGIKLLPTVFRAWNCLEDQRMETAVVTDSPRKAAYLTPLIMTEHTRNPSAMAANYPLLVWRRYLPRKLRDAARRMFIASHNLVGKDGEALARRCEAIVTSYVLATDVKVMWQAVCDFHLLLNEMQPLSVVDFGHDKQKQVTSGERNLDDYLVIPVDPDMVTDGPCGGEPEDEPDEPDYTDPEVAEHIIDTLIAMFWHPETLVPVIMAGTSVSESEDSNPGAPTPQQDGQDEPEQGDEPSEGSKGGKGADDNDGAGADGEHTDDGADNTDDGTFDQDDIDKMLQEAEDERNSMSELDADMKAFDEARDQDSKLEVYTGGISGDAEAVGKAVALAEQIERAFQTHTMDMAPAWVEQQRRGMLNVLRYRTRRPGEVEIFKQWIEDEQPGYDIAVSLMLDYSGSMDWALVPLAQCAYATKLACQKLGIPCTVTLWDTNAKVLWDANERTEGMPVLKDDGGTNPGRALADLGNQRLDKAKHIVMIMTDGEWQGWANRTLDAYKEPGRHITGFGFGSRSLRNKLLGYGCDDAFAINDLMEIPHRLEQFLVESV